MAESRWARTWRAAVRCNVEGVLRVGGNAARAGVNASGEVEVRYAYPEAAKDAAECYDGVSHRGKVFPIDARRKDIIKHTSVGEGARSQGFADSFRLAGTVFFVELAGGPSDKSVSYGRLTQHTRWRGVFSGCAGPLARPSRGGRGRVAVGDRAVCPVPWHSHLGAS